MLTRIKHRFRWSAESSATTVAAHAGKYSLESHIKNDQILFISSPIRPGTENLSELTVRVNGCVCTMRPTSAGSREFRLLLSNVVRKGGKNTFKISEIKNGKGTIDCQINLTPAKMKGIHLPEHEMTWTPTVELQRTFVRLTKSGDENRAVVKLQARLNGNNLQGDCMVFDHPMSKAEYLQPWPERLLTKTGLTKEAFSRSMSMKLPSNKSRIRIVLAKEYISDKEWKEGECRYLVSLMKDGSQVNLHVGLADGLDAPHVLPVDVFDRANLQEIRSFLRNLRWQGRIGESSCSVYHNGARWNISLNHEDKDRGITHTMDTSPINVVEVTSKDGTLHVSLSNGDVMSREISGGVIACLKASLNEAPIIVQETIEFTHQSYFETETYEIQRKGPADDPVCKLKHTHRASFGDLNADWIHGRPCMTYKRGGEVVGRVFLGGNDFVSFTPKDFREIVLQRHRVSTRAIIKPLSHLGIEYSDHVLHWPPSTSHSKTNYYAYCCRNGQLNGCHVNINFGNAIVHGRAIITRPATQSDKDNTSKDQTMSSLPPGAPKSVIDHFRRGQRPRKEAEKRQAPDGPSVQKEDKASGNRRPPNLGNRRRRPKK